MSIQIAVRLPDDLVRFLDEEVKDGRGTGRAAIVTRALEREQRRRVAERDADILAASSGADDLAGLAEFAASTAIPLD
ncbi:MAG: antitoxin [Tessaracoccus sp.]|uniref:antitoxin n=1 Tax=Tessaracoccus sp. TaxID=1971211 RepID=UPI001ECE3A2A|nr:antitoxin [Tessaracoccus sp.]MBK7822526.1 antitoxin [Tessaracoccus sp.]